MLTATCIAGATGATTVTVNAVDVDGTMTSSSFVLQVIGTSKSPPSITNDPATQKRYLTWPSPTASPIPSPSPFQYKVASTTANLQDLRVTAISSNTNLVPNDFTTNLVVSQPDTNGIGTVQVRPVLPIPAPSPGVPQSSTITLSVTDDSYVRQTTFLYVAGDPVSMNPFSRASGVYSLLPTDIEHRQDVAFLTGETQAIRWSDIERTEGVYTWNTLDDGLDNLPLNQDLSLNIQLEPCYIAKLSGVTTWCDTGSRKPNPDYCTTKPCPSGAGFLRAVPWDATLQTKEDAFLDQLKMHLTSKGLLTKVSVINPNIPGGSNGIRDITGPNEPLDDTKLPGYTREKFLAAIQHELRAIQDKFPASLVQIGFFKPTDLKGPTDGGGDGTYDDELWQWLYRGASDSIDSNGIHLVSLFDEFNGIRKPRVNFFQEDLAAARATFPPANPTASPTPSSFVPNYITPALSSAYSFTPDSGFVPSFGYYVTPNSGQYNNGITFQSNAAWSNPFLDPQGSKLTKTINGSPNDGMEAAFNTWLSEYLEIYPPDITLAQPLEQIPPAPATWDAILWQGQLQSWHDYTKDLRAMAPLEAPAGLSVTRNLDNSNTISWLPVYALVDASPVTYSVDRKMGANWISICSLTTGLQCMDSQSPGSAYQYRVRAVKGTNAPTPYAYVAGFLSESGYDGYVLHDLVAFIQPDAAYPMDPQPGIRAGQSSGVGLESGPDLRGILSFNTSSLSGATILTAKLRLKQSNTTNTAFTTLGTCFVDIEKGSFSGNMVLQTGDFSFSDANTGMKVAQILPPAVPPDWSETYLDATGVSKISNVSMGRTQFRLYFNHANVSNTYVGWYAGDANITGTSTPPQLVVQYTP